MVKSLSPAISKRLEKALNSWPYWQCEISQTPTLIEPLEAGISNHSFLVADKHQQFVIRLQDTRLSLTPAKTEYQYQLLAAQQGIAPMPVYLCEKIGVFVSLFQANINTEHTPEKIGHLLNSLHKLDAPAHTLAWQDYTAHYYATLDKHHQNSFKKEQLLINQLLDELYENEPLLPSHGDLLKANRLAHDNTLYAIDFEYAGLAPRWLDLATVIAGDKLDAKQSAALVRSYLQREPTVHEQLKINGFIKAYHYLEKLWYLQAR